MPRFTRSDFKPYLAEFIGTGFIVLIGDGVIAQVLLSDYKYGTWLSINLAWAVAISLSGYLSDPSPTVNPAVSITMALIRPSQGAWKQLPGKIAAQMLGGFVGAALLYANYVSAIDAWDPERTIPGGSILSPSGHNSAGIFATYPGAYYSKGATWGPALNEGLGAAVLMFALLAIGDPLNKERLVAPQFSIFATVLGIGAALGWQTGYAINPARDLGPRLLTAIFYGSEVFTVGGYYFFVPLLAPVVGCLFGALVYDALLYEGEGSYITNAVNKLDDREGAFRLD